MMTERELIKKEIVAVLGGNLVDIQLDSDTIETNISLAFSKYRQRSSNSVEEAFAFLTFQPGVNEYTLPSETVDVRQIYRRRFGTAGISDGDSTSGEQFDPFSLSFANIFLLEAGSLGGLLTYNLYNQYLDLAATMFGSNVNFTWNTRTKRLQIMRTPQDHEEVLIWVFKKISDDEILNDPQSRMWIFEMALAYCKMTLGNAYEQYTSLAGPNGSVTLNGTQLKAEAALAMERLEKEIREFIDGGTPLSFIVG